MITSSLSKIPNLQREATNLTALMGSNAVQVGIKEFLSPEKSSTDALKAMGSSAIDTAIREIFSPENMRKILGKVATMGLNHFNFPVK